MLSPDTIRAESGARQMRNHIVKQCQANDSADNTAGNCVQCARGQDGTSWTLQTIVGDPVKRFQMAKSPTIFIRRVPLD